MPDTLNYLLFGLVVTTLLMTVFIGSFLIRWRSLKQDMETLEELFGEE